MTTTHGGKRPGAGRPKGSKTRRIPATLRERVALCAADQMPVAVIAAVLGIQEGRLRAEFAHELQHAVALVRSEQLAALAVAAQGGNAAASRALLDIASRPEPERADEQQPETSDLVGRALRLLDGGRK
jgi:hypothetical protein